MMSSVGVAFGFLSYDFLTAAIGAIGLGGEVSFGAIADGIYPPPTDVIGGLSSFLSAIAEGMYEEEAVAPAGLAFESIRGLEPNPGLLAKPGLEPSIGLELSLFFSFSSASF